MTITLGSELDAAEADGSRPESQQRRGYKATGQGMDRRLYRLRRAPVNRRLEDRGVCRGKLLIDAPTLLICPHGALHAHVSRDKPFTNDSSRGTARGYHHSGKQTGRALVSSLARVPGCRPASPKRSRPPLFLPPPPPGSCARAASTDLEQRQLRHPSHKTPELSRE